MFYVLGADIKEMQHNTYAQNVRGNFLSHWNRVASCRKPVIAAVNGYAVSSYLGLISDLIIICCLILLVSVVWTDEMESGLAKGLYFVTNH
jgi:1,4-dihydroxy-2-naphthoyl-CoA synthase